MYYDLLNSLDLQVVITNEFKIRILKANSVTMLYECDTMGELQAYLFGYSDSNNDRMGK